MPKIYPDSLNLHKRLGGKLSTFSKVKISNKRNLSLAYTPGVAEVSKQVASNPKTVFDYTLKKNSLAVVSDGSAVLGLGNVGAHAAIPVMEGKAVLFKEFVGLDAFPICIDSQDPSVIVDTVKNISPVFGAINLEDIASPKCFEVEQKLQNLGIPVMHDDQHATAVVVLAALLNASKVVKKDLEEMQIVISGAGAAGTAIAKLLLCLGVDDAVCRRVKNVVVVDSKGAIFDGRKDLEMHKQELALSTNRLKVKGSLEQVLAGADVFVGVSRQNLVTPKMVSSMEKNPVVFALANPEPEITPRLAFLGGAKIVGTGRSDLPNQINNVLAFPGIFRGAMDAKASFISSKMKLAASHAIASCVKKPSAKKIVPLAITKSVHVRVASAVKKASLFPNAPLHNGV